MIDQVECCQNDQIKLIRWSERNESYDLSCFKSWSMNLYDFKKNIVSLWKRINVCLQFNEPNTLSSSLFSSPFET